MPTPSVNLKKLCENLEKELREIFLDYAAGVSSREDSRAFGAMIEKRMTSNWEAICAKLKTSYLPNPGRRTIYDFACTLDGVILGFDVKTKDLDETSYSDGGVCAVGNLLKFMANDKAVFFVVEFGHHQTLENKSSRELDYIRVAPFHLLPAKCYRIENLGTGQVRLNHSVSEVWEEIDWKRSYQDFFDIFTDLAIVHYERVSHDALKRIESINQFKKNNYASFKFLK